jgi:hypothetical protein
MQYITWYRRERYVIDSDLLMLLVVVVVQIFYAENVRGKGCFGDLGIDVRIKVGLSL